MANAAEPTTLPALTVKPSDAERALLLGTVLLGSIYIVVRPAASQFMPYSMENGFAAIIAILFAFTSSFRALVAGPAIRVPASLVAAAVLWIGLFVWGALRSPNLGVAVPQACDAIIYMLVLMSGYFVSRREPALIALFTRAIIAMVVVEACLGIWQRFVDLPFLQSQVRSGSEVLPAALQSHAGLSRLYGLDVFGSFGNPNSLAGFLVIGIWLTVGHCFSATNIKQRLPGLLFVFVMLLALAFTNSKGGIASCMAGAWFFLLQRLNTKPSLQRALSLLSIVGIVAGVLIVALAYIGKLPTPLSLTFRLDYWRAAFGMISQHPLDGVGLAGFAENYTFFKTPLGTETKDAHNDYIHFLAELGVLGPLIYGAIWFMLLRGSITVVTTTSVASADSRRLERLVLGAGLLGFVFMYLGFQPFNSTELLRLVFGESNSQTVLNAMFSLSLPIVFACVIVSLRPSGESGSTSALQQGFVAASGALLVHQFVDFDFKAQAVMNSMFLLGGMYLGLRHQMIESNETASNKLNFAGKLLPIAAGVLLVPFAVWFPMISGGHRAHAEILEQEAAQMVREKPPEGDDIEADKKYRALRREIAEARLQAAHSAPYDANAWLDFANALQYVQREYHSISVEKEVEAAIEQGERLRPLAAYPKVVRGDLYFYDGIHRMQRKASGVSSLEKALAAYSAAEARYPLAPGFPLLKGDALLMLDRTAEAAAEYLRAFQIDMLIYDGNVRLNAVFTDPRPGVLPRHGFERQISFQVQQRLKNLSGDEHAQTRRGLLLRRTVSLAALLQESKRVGAVDAKTVISLERELNATLNVFLNGTQELQERAHATLLLALSFKLTPSLPEFDRNAAWQLAKKLQDESISAGRAGTPPSLFDYFYATFAPK